MTGIYIVTNLINKKAYIVKHLITGGFDPFCVEHNLSKTMMREVLNNKKENHRRWKVERATSKEE